MAYIDQSFYYLTFNGTIIDNATFERLAETASDIIDGIVAKPVSSIDTSSDAYAKVKKACAYIVEYLGTNGGIDAINGNSGVSESLGDYSISSGDASGKTSWFGDIHIPQMAISQLRLSGLMSRWAYAGTVIDDGH